MIVEIKSPSALRAYEAIGGGKGFIKKMMAVLDFSEQEEHQEPRGRRRTRRDVAFITVASPALENCIRARCKAERKSFRRFFEEVLEGHYGDTRRDD